MASTVTFLLLLFALLFTATVADNDCKSYISSGGAFKNSINCNFLQFCCGTCDNRYCCSNPSMILTEDAQEDCFFNNNNLKPIAIGVTITGIAIFVIVFIVCCVCPCCCIYKMCRNPRPVMGATTTTVVTTQYPQQPVIQGVQYPPYQPVPPQLGYGAQPAYGGQPMPTGPYKGQPYVAGPPPPYQEAGPGYPVPYSQAAYDGGQAGYPIQPPVQPGFAHPPQPTDYSSNQPAYNPNQPAYNPNYVEPPKTGY
ncbi:protein shisa-5-like isoform X2 [Myxocyprinus asiaticus]|uniref:protein shisa-5-like isoform X2 n=1 Tax=Myxocyprinus asiaticus TaxID=70543 RepID=UPI002221FCED|nr:protein shisa-5-like isoform X2 [Myxocyprinus asiaticus]